MVTRRLDERRAVGIAKLIFAKAFESVNCHLLLTKQNANTDSPSLSSIGLNPSPSDTLSKLTPAAEAENCVRQGLVLDHILFVIFVDD